jgi:hypothetical protein
MRPSRTGLSRSAVFDCDGTKSEINLVKRALRCEGEPSTAYRMGAMADLLLSISWDRNENGLTYLASGCPFWCGSGVESELESPRSLLHSSNSILSRLDSVLLPTISDFSRSHLRMLSAKASLLISAYRK